MADERIDHFEGEPAETLEALHVASETADHQETKTHGEVYLEAARTVVP